MKASAHVQAMATTSSGTNEPIGCTNIKMSTMRMMSIELPTSTRKSRRIRSSKAAFSAGIPAIWILKFALWCFSMMASVC